jgi:hypothetical protein
MTSSRSQRPDVGRDATGGTSGDETPELNIYEIHSDRTVFTEPGNTDGWIATDETVACPE